MREITKAGPVELDNPMESNGLYPNPEQLLAGDKIRLAILQKMVGNSILSVRQFDKTLVLELCKFAALLEATEIAVSHPLDGKIVITAFFEASTRTRLSFESSVLRLDGKIISIPDGQITGVAKGESLADIGEMFNAYGDAVIMRHTETGSIDEILKGLRVPLINAGNGTGEHRRRPWRIGMRFSSGIPISRTSNRKTSESTWASWGRREA